MSKRKRGFTRHTYTVMRDSEATTYPPVDPVWMYMRGEGQIAPSPSVASVQAGDADFDVVNEIIVHTKQDYPLLDSSETSDFGIGDAYYPDYVIYKDTPHTAYGQNVWEKNGKNNYRKVTCIYDSGQDYGDYIARRAFRDLNWWEITDFETAVNGVGFTNDLFLSQVLDNRGI